MAADSKAFVQIYDRLSEYYGHQAWWPADNLFEILVGAILTQNTAWTNVEKAIKNLKQKGLCNSQSLSAIDQSQLAPLIRSSGYFNQKSERLIRFAKWYEQRGGFENLMLKGLQDLRTELLRLNGIGDETADDMLLYAFDKPSFIIDTYTRRIFSRMNLLAEKSPYLVLQNAFQQALPCDLTLYQQYHALIVTHAKKHCLKKPMCHGCPLREGCSYE